MQKRIGIINDISCEGRCSITGALPIISCAGIHANVIPTALLSTQTGGYTDYTYLDLSCEMLSIAEHFKRLDLQFDVIYSGYLSGEKQIDIVTKIVDMLQPKIFIADPVMGDGGQLYSGFSSGYIDKMRYLCSRANVIVPNITEACLLTGWEYGRMDEEEIKEMLYMLQSNRHQGVVITGIGLKDNHNMAVGILDGDRVQIETHKEIKGTFHGAGDVFGSALACGIAYGKKPVDAAKVACDFTFKAIDMTSNDKTDTRQGLNFEKCLGIIFDEYNR